MLDDLLKRWRIPLELKSPTLWFIGGLLLYFFGLMLHPLVDPDVFIHLRDGRYWVESSFQPGNDPFAFTISDQAIEKVELPFRIGLYWCWQLGGYPLLIILKALLMTLAMAGFSGLLYRRWNNLGVVALTLGAAILALWTRVMPERPQIFTLLLLPVCLLWLETHVVASPPEKTVSFRNVWFIPLIVLPWANLHPGFIILYVFLAAYGIDALWQYCSDFQSRHLQQAGVVVLIAGAALMTSSCNPMGFSLYHFITQNMNNPMFLHSIVEWMPPELAQKPFFFLILLLAWLLQILSLRSARMKDLLLLLVFSYLSLQSRRNIALFIIAVLPAMVGNARSLWQRWAPAATLSLVQRKKSLYLGTGVVAVLLLFTTVTGYAFRLGLFPNYHPSQGLAWLESNSVKGRLFAPLHWGGYIGWETHGRRPVFMDGRLPAFAGKVYTDYSKIIYGDPNGCLPALDEYRIEIIMVSTKNYFQLFQQLSQSGKWALVYWDHVSEIYLRRSGLNQDLIRRSEFRYADPNATPFADPNHLSQALLEINRAQQQTPSSFLAYFFAGDILLRQGQWQSAQAQLEQAHRLSPLHPFTLFDLGLLAYRSNDWRTAENYFRSALRNQTEKNNQAQVLYYLALTLKTNPVRLPAALKFARQSNALLPNQAATIQLLEELNKKP